MSWSRSTCLFEWVEPVRPIPCSSCTTAPLPRATRPTENYRPLFQCLARVTDCSLAVRRVLGHSAWACTPTHRTATTYTPTLPHSRAHTYTHKGLAHAAAEQCASVRGTLLAYCSLHYTTKTSPRINSHNKYGSEMTQRSGTRATERNEKEKLAVVSEALTSARPDTNSPAWQGTSWQQCHSSALSTNYLPRQSALVVISS